MSIESLIAQVALAHGIPEEYWWIPIGLATGESGLDPSNVGDNGHSVGLFMLHDQGVGYGMGDLRYDPNANANAIMPAIADALWGGLAAGMSDYDLFEYVWFTAERPADTPQARQHMRNTYEEVMGMPAASAKKAMPKSITANLSDFAWPVESAYTDPVSGQVDYGAYYSDVGTVAALFAEAGIPLPAGAPAVATAAYEARKVQIGQENDPLIKAKARAQIDQIYGTLGVAKENAATNRMSAQTQARGQTAQEVADYLEWVGTSIANSLDRDALRTDQAVKEGQRHLDLFKEAGAQYRDLQDFSIPLVEGQEHLYGFEPGGFAESLGLEPYKATPQMVDPFNMAKEILATTPSPWDVGISQEPPGYGGDDIFARALEFYRSGALSKPASAGVLAAAAPPGSTAAVPSSVPVPEAAPMPEPPGMGGGPTAPMPDIGAAAGLNSIANDPGFDIPLSEILDLIRAGKV